MTQKTRRQFMTSTMGAGAAGVAAGLSLVGSAPAADPPKRGYRLSTDELKARFNDPIWNRETSAKIEGDTAPGKYVNGYVTGTVMGVRDNEAVRALFGFEVFSSIRVLKQENGDYQRLCRELIFYRDLNTGELMDSWLNPYTNEQVAVVDVANDPFNYVISDHFPDPPTYGGLNTVKPPRRPLIRNWILLNEDTVVLTSDIHLYYRNKLDPAIWVRESAGPMNRVSELFRYSIRREDIENDALTHMPHTGVWNRITPWLPWMLMGTTPGHIVYAGTFSSVPSVDWVPAPVAKRVRERFPQYAVAPEKWVDPSYSSLENYARTQKPAKPK
ncbi:MAG: DUF1838 domain-containing protein [Gammaproteobacteria bacterium]|nr:DUF1838 domain-containing protein [Gammaproteobacteria bacterium]